MIYVWLRSLEYARWRLDLGMSGAFARQHNNIRNARPVHQLDVRSIHSPMILVVSHQTRHVSELMFTHGERNNQC